MKKSRFSESKIVNILKQQEGGRTIQEISREYGISQATFFNWKSKYGGMSASHLKRLKELEEENLRLKKMYADKSLQNDALKDLLEKKL
ncbi:IS3 family transposase ISSse3 [subsurface metagenome]